MAEVHRRGEIDPALLDLIFSILQENSCLIENGTFPKQLRVASKDAKHKVVIMYILQSKRKQAA